jgi:hypothetical protein
MSAHDQTPQISPSPTELVLKKTCPTPVLVLNDPEIVLSVKTKSPPVMLMPTVVHAET